MRRPPHPPSSQSKSGQEFKASLTFDLTAYHFAVARLMTKIALGLGHRVLGPEWTFGPGGELLRKGLWTVPGDKPPPICGTISDQVNQVFGPLLGIAPNKHVMAVMGGPKTAAIIALFGGELGIAAIDLGIDTQAFFENFGDEARGGCVFEIPLTSELSQRRLVSRTFRQVANDAVRAGRSGRGAIPGSKPAACGRSLSE
jgi:hypothetical protein